MARTERSRRMTRGSWIAGAAAGWMITLLLPTLAPALERHHGFTCKPQEDLTLECEATGLSDAKRAPEWAIAVDGQQVDRARGWRAVLYPRAGRVNTITMRAFIRDREVTLAHNWGKPAPEGPPPEAMLAQGN